MKEGVLVDEANNASNTFMSAKQSAKFKALSHLFSHCIEKKTWSKTTYTKWGLAGVNFRGQEDCDIR